MDNEPASPNAAAYRELCDRMGPGPWLTADIAERARLHAIGLQEGWLTKQADPPKDDSGGAWNRTNPPKRGKPGNAKWRR